MIQELRIEVNKACNFACIHCYTDKKGPKSLDVDRFIETIRNAAAQGTTDLSLTGGEPLLDMKRTTELARTGMDAGMTVRLNTNGMLLNEERLLQLKEAGVAELQISLHSPDAARFDAFVQRRGAFHRVADGIVAAVAHGFQVTARFTLMVGNIPDLLPTFRFAEACGMHTFKVRALVQVSGIHEETWSQSHEQLHQALAELAVEARTSRMKLYVADGGVGFRPNGEGNCSYMHCKCGTQALFVGSDGAIAPCPFLREEESFSLGNLQEHDLADISANSQRLKEFIGNHTSHLGGNECTYSCRAAELAAELEERKALVEIAQLLPTETPPVLA